MVKRFVEVGFISELIVGEMSKIWTAALESEKPEKHSGDGYGRKLVWGREIQQVANLVAEAFKKVMKVFHQSRDHLQRNKLLPRQWHSPE